MTTTREIITRAMRRIRIVDAMQQPSAEDADLVLDALNDMMHAWQWDGVPIEHTDLTLTDTFYFFVPPLLLADDVLADLAYQGTWDADANTPTLGSGSGTSGYWYRVATAGSTTIDANSSWAVNDALVFGDDTETWRKSLATLSRRYEAGVIDMLAERVAPDFGVPIMPDVARGASKGWRAIQGAFVRPPNARFDTALSRLPSRRYYRSGNS